jgi:hypothetical protein
MLSSRVAKAAAIAVASCAMVLGAGGSPAHAARYIEQSGGFSCDSRLVRVAPPRVYAAYGLERAAWGINVQRWSGTYWYAYTSSTHLASFNYWGFNMSGWTGNRYVNNRMNVPVSHPGFYRVSSAVVAPGVQSEVWVAGGNYCQMA